jgi:hypothetical protein
MSNEMTLFANKANFPVLPDSFKDDMLDRLAGAGGGGARISIRGSVFREIVNGKEVRVSEERSMNVVLINAAPISRMYYEQSYDADAGAVAPTCWSSDTETPDASVPEDQRQSARCSDCPMNIKGSGKGETRACKYSQRVAVMLDGAIEERKVYQMQLPATSVFGDGNKDKMPLQAYGRLLRANNTHPISIVTKMRFDIDAAVPTLTFSAVRPLTQDELDVCVEMRDSPAAINAITLSVGETDGTKAGKKAEEKKPELFEPEEDESEEDESEEEVVVEKKAPKKKPAPVKEVEEEVEEPKKMPAKGASREAPIDVGSLLDEWDD